MNKVVLEIQNEKGEWITWENTVIPVKYGKLLDEQLDYKNDIFGKNRSQ